MHEKITKLPKFTQHLHKNARILHGICLKSIIPEIWGEGHVPHLAHPTYSLPPPPPTPTSMKMITVVTMADNYLWQSSM